MKAAVLRKVGEPIEIIEVEIDAPMPHEVKVRVKASGLCHSDLTIMNNDYGWPVPIVMGHEIAGVVESVGSEVTALSVGDHVVGTLVTSCGNCQNCRRGKPITCLNPDASRRSKNDPPRLTLDGQSVHPLGDIGGFAEFSLVHERNLVKVDPSIPFDRACLLGCGVITGAGAVINTAGVRVGETVAVIGCGGVGLNAIQAAALSGARRVIAIDIQPAKLELARRFGATDVINSAEVDDLAATVREIVGARGVDHAFEVIGLAPTAQQAIDISDVGGTAYMVGLQSPETRVSLGASDLLRGQRTLHGVHMGSALSEVDIPLYADLYLQGRFNLDDLVSQTISLDDINEGYRVLESGRVARSVVVFD